MSLADWGSLAAEVIVFTKRFADGDEAVRSLAGFDVPRGHARADPIPG
jgi:hypothetical protein